MDAISKNLDQSLSRFTRSWCHFLVTSLFHFFCLSVCPSWLLDSFQSVTFWHSTFVWKVSEKLKVFKVFRGEILHGRKSSLHGNLPLSFCSFLYNEVCFDGLKLSFQSFSVCILFLYECLFFKGAPCPNELTINVSQNQNQNQTSVNNRHMKTGCFLGLPKKLL